MHVRINGQHKNMFLFRTHYKESIYGSSTITSDKQTYIQFERQKKTEAYPGKVCLLSHN